MCQARPFSVLHCKVVGIMCYCPCRTCPVLLVPVTSRVYFPAHGLTISCCGEDFKITSGGGSNLRLEQPSVYHPGGEGRGGEGLDLPMPALAQCARHECRLSVVPAHFPALLTRAQPAPAALSSLPTAPTLLGEHMLIWVSPSSP